METQKTIIYLDNNATTPIDQKSFGCSEVISEKCMYLFISVRFSVKKFNKEKNGQNSLMLRKKLLMN